MLTYIHVMDFIILLVEPGNIENKLKYLFEIVKSPGIGEGREGLYQIYDKAAVVVSQCLQIYKRTDFLLFFVSPYLQSKH